MVSSALKHEFWRFCRWSRALWGPKDHKKAPGFVVPGLFVIALFRSLLIQNPVVTLQPNQTYIIGSLFDQQYYFLEELVYDL